MELFLTIVAFILIIAGIIGSILPALPGPPASWVGLLILNLIGLGVSLQTVIVWGVIVAIISLLDYFVAPMLTNRAGGSRMAAIGSMVGVVLAVFVFPISIFLGAFLGAFLGELIHDSKDVQKALVVGFYSFLGFLIGTFMKVVVCVWILWLAISSIS